MNYFCKVRKKRTVFCHESIRLLCDAKNDAVGSKLITSYYRCAVLGFRPTRPRGDGQAGHGYCSTYERSGAGKVVNEKIRSSDGRG
jgi:hypothetical protein